MEEQCLSDLSRRKQSARNLSRVVIREGRKKEDIYSLNSKDILIEAVDGRW